MMFLSVVVLRLFKPSISFLAILSRLDPIFETEQPTLANAAEVS